MAAVNHDILVPRWNLILNRGIVRRSGDDIVFPDLEKEIVMEDLVSFYRDYQIGSNDDGDKFFSKRDKGSDMWIMSALRDLSDVSEDILSSLFQREEKVGKIILETIFGQDIDDIETYLQSYSNEFDELRKVLHSVDISWNDDMFRTNITDVYGLERNVFSSASDSESVSMQSLGVIVEKISVPSGLPKVRLMDEINRKYPRSPGWVADIVSDFGQQDPSISFSIWDGNHRFAWLSRKESFGGNVEFIWIRARLSPDVIEYAQRSIQKLRRVVFSFYSAIRKRIEIRKTDDNQDHVAHGIKDVFDSFQAFVRDTAEAKKGVGLKLPPLTKCARSMLI